MVIGERSHTLTLNASDGAITQVKSKYLFDESDKESDVQFLDEESGQAKENKLSTEETILIRMSALDEIEDIVDQLFYRFLSRRLAQAFVTQDVSSIRSTIAEKLAEKLPKVEQAPREAILESPVPS
jgi:hypothetical protein